MKKAVPESLFQKRCRPEFCNFIKKEALAQCFPMNFAKLFRTPFLHNSSCGCFCRAKKITNFQNLSKFLKRQLWWKAVSVKIVESFLVSVLITPLGTFSNIFYLFKVNIGNTRKRCEICSKYWCCSDILLLALKIFHNFF